MASSLLLIEKFVFEFQEAAKHLHYLLEKFPLENFEVKPAPNKWSAAECLVHINTTNEKYLINLKNSLENAQKSNLLKEEYKPRYLMSKFIDTMKPESRWKFKAPSVFKKSYDGNLDKTVNDFFRIQDELIELAERSREYDLSKTKTVSPVSKLFRLKLGEAFMVIIEHQKRHLLQAETALRKSV